MTSSGGPPPGRPKPRVLVIDDEPGNLFTFRRVFNAQYDVTIASNGPEALLRVEATTEADAFDVVLVDFAMPEMDGAQFLAKLRQGHPNLPCLFLTAYAELEEVKKASGRYRVAAVIMKPWEKEDVERRIEHAIRLAKMKRATAPLRP
jgi:CheY-like chemotaxis protein